MRWLLVAASLLAADRARADGNAEADKLFDEGLALRKTNPEAACVKFRAAYRLNPQAIGMLLNDALCDAKDGLTASAVEKFSEARDRAREQNLPEVLEAAEKELATLVPELPYLTIELASPVARDTRVMIDDRVVPLDKLVERPVDPGDRVVVVTAPGKVAFKVTVKVSARKRDKVAVPRLADRGRGSGRGIGKLVTAGGVVAIGSGIGLGLWGRSRYNAQFPDGCNADGVCTAEAHAATESARTIGNVGTAVTIVGVGAVAVGAYLWFRSSGTPDAAPPAGKVSLVPHIGPGGAGVTAVGRF